MTQASARILVSVGEQSACLKIVGRANFTSSIDFRVAATELCQHSPNCLVLELSECTLMDSTFLGVMAGLGVRMGGGPAGPGQHPIILLNPNSRILDLLETLGILHLFKLAKGTPAPISPVEPVTRNPTAPDPEQVTRACLDAHQTLMEINPANVPKFKDVAAFLAEDLKKLKSSPQPG